MEPEPTDAAFLESRKEIWAPAFETLYDAGYNEIFSEKMLQRWQHFDDVTRIVAAITATSSSAVAGLAIWSWPVFKQIWIVLAAVGVILTIISSSLRTQVRLKEWTASKHEFGALYIELETFMFNMRIEKKAPVAETKRVFGQWRKSYIEAKQRLPMDGLSTSGTARLSQEAMDIRIKRSILYRPNETDKK